MPQLQGGRRTVPLFRRAVLRPPAGLRTLPKGSRDRIQCCALAVPDLIAEARREGAEQGWDEGLSAGCDRWCDSREFGDPPANPYRQETSA